MNILVVAHCQGDGSATAIFIEAQIKAYVQAGHSVRVIAPLAYGKRGYHGGRLNSTVAEEVIVGAPHVFVRYLSLSKYGVSGFNTKRAIKAIKRNFFKIIADFIPDVIHVHTLGFDSEIGAWLKEQSHCPLVVTTHGSDTFAPIREGKGQMLKRFADKASAVVCVSSKLKRALEEEHVSTPLKVVLNGFDIQSRNCEPKKTFLSLNQTGNLIEPKKTDVTIRALAKLRNVHPEATLSIAGQGPDRSGLEKLCESLGVTRNVHFLGQLDNGTVQKEMAKARFFVMPSVREGFGIVYLEAMAAGCITIGTEGEGIADLIRSGENGFLVPPDNPNAIVNVIEWCLKNPDEALQIAERGRLDAMGLTWARNAKQYIELFQVLIGNKDA